MAGRVEAAAAKAALISAALDAGTLRGKARALARQRGALDAMRAEAAAARQAPAPPPKGGRRSWRAVVMGDTGITGFKGATGPQGNDRTGGRGATGSGQRGRDWDINRTIFLSPVDNSFLKKHIDSGVFGAGLGRALGANTCGTVIRTGAGLFKAELEKNIFEKILERGEVEVPGFGAWRASRMRASAMPSVVITGVDPGMSDGAVATGLIHGARGMFGEEERGLLGSLRASRLFSGARSRDSGRDGGRDAGGRSSTGSGGSPPPPTPTRSVRVYADPKVLAKFEALGEVKLGWALLPCRPYVPRQFYCRICDRMGGHSTERHRGCTREGERRDGRSAGAHPRP